MPQVWSSPVRFVECDQQGLVFNAHYLVWADEAVNNWWAGRGMDWPELNGRGLEYVVVASAL
ncbi:MAG: putative thioesterase, partial [Blastococcus sp.]|nr:putative thioesterase [Blastococcus sp.]